MPFLILSALADNDRDGAAPPASTRRVNLDAQLCGAFRPLAADQQPLRRLPAHRWGCQIIRSIDWRPDANPQTDWHRDLSLGPYGYSARRAVDQETFAFVPGSLLYALGLGQAQSELAGAGLTPLPPNGSSCGRGDEQLGCWTYGRELTALVV
jgi:hypothetical protein